jgi:hypothetical protein
VSLLTKFRHTASGAHASQNLHRGDAAPLTQPNELYSEYLSSASARGAARPPRLRASPARGATNFGLPGPGPVRRPAAFAARPTCTSLCQQRGRIFYHACIHLLTGKSFCCIPPTMKCIVLIEFDDDRASCC